MGTGRYIVELQDGLTLATWPRRSCSSPSNVRFSLRAVLRAASLELSRASRSLSRAWADSKSPSFLVLLEKQGKRMCKRSGRGGDPREGGFCAQVWPLSLRQPAESSLAPTQVPRKGKAGAAIPCTASREQRCLEVVPSALASLGGCTPTSCKIPQTPFLLLHPSHESGLRNVPGAKGT